MLKKVALYLIVMTHRTHNENCTPRKQRTDSQDVNRGAFWEMAKEAFTRSGANATSSGHRGSGQE